MNGVSHSALHPAGPAASVISSLWWLMFSVCGVAFLLVMFLLVLALVKRRKSSPPEPPFGDSIFIVLGGIVLPTVILFVFLARTLKDTAALAVPETSLTIEVTGFMWWWHVRYPSDNITIANELYIPVGAPVRITMTSADVVHSFWVPSLSGKTDLIPGQTTVHWLKADKPGIYRGQCAEFCGLQHAKMAFYVVALPPEEFQTWLQSKHAIPDIDADDRLKAGLAAFMDAGCGECHAIKGTEATGTIGPDLTHMGSRKSLGAGSVPNNRGYLMGWISNPQHIKPGNHMPPAYISPADLDGIATFLEQLR